MTERSEVTVPKSFLGILIFTWKRTIEAVKAME